MSFRTFNRPRNLYFLLFALIFLMASCFPVFTTSRKWKIRWDEDMENSKKAFLAKQESGDQKKPNVILIVADDLGKYEVSTYGAEHISTPNIDALGAEGAVFDEGYVTAPVCSPSRAGILTGRYQQRYGFNYQTMEYYPRLLISYAIGKRLVDTDGFEVKTGPHYPSKRNMKKQGIPTQEMTLAELFKANGYATAISGKWHVGHSKYNIPNSMGFDYQYGIYGASSLYTADHASEGCEKYIQPLFSSRYQWKNGRKGTSAVMENDEVVEEKDYLTFAIKDKAIDWMEDHKEDPFFLYIPFTAPHVPFQAPHSYYEQYSHIKDKNKRVYYAMISALDDAIGDIVKAVDEKGLAENTIIWFVSDNGGASYTGATDNGPLKGGKLTTFEGGVNVPFMVRWTGHIEPGTRFEDPVLALDIFSTSVKAANLELPDDRAYDGVDLMPYLKGECNEQPHESIYWISDHIKAMRKGDYKFILSERDNWAHLYNLKTDKSEKIDLMKDESEILDQMLDEHAKWMEQLSPKPLWPRIMDHKFTIDGQVYYFPA